MLGSDDRAIYALSHIERNYSETNEVELVADRAMLTPRQLTSMVKKLTGMNYNQYLHYTRAREAYSLLINSDQLITDIAFQVGYQDSNYFSTKFKQIFKVTPREVRQSL